MVTIVEHASAMCTGTVACSFHWEGVYVGSNAEGKLGTEYYHPITESALMPGLPVVILIKSSFLKYFLKIQKCV